MAVLGPTASGKTKLAVELARRLDAEIISVDSMQVYRGMDIGTAKSDIVERRGVVHHMIDVVDPDQEYSVAEFRDLARDTIKASEGPVIIAGGSGLHFRAIVDPMSFAPTEPELRRELEADDLESLVAWLEERDPDAGAVVDLQNKRRVVRAVEIARLTGELPTERAASAEADDLARYVPELEFTAVGIDPGADLDQRISGRLASMRSGGLLEEVSALKGRLGKTASLAVGYRELLAHLDGQLELEEAFVEIERNTLRLAKKQRTWFQRDPRIRWIPWTNSEDQVERAMEILK